MRQALRQALACMDRCAAVSAHLVVFNRSEGRCWQDKSFRREEQMDEGTLTVWGGSRDAA